MSKESHRFTKILKIICMFVFSVALSKVKR